VKLLLDMNLSPDWVPVLQAAGHEATHWSAVGSPRAPDTEIMAWARKAGHVVVTQDLDYGALLFATQATAPSVMVLRTEDVRPKSIGSLVVAALKSAESDLLTGALVTVDPRRSRINTLPLRRKSAP
jgi:predicted nuclease of predicted toxin-antitoxin system